MSLPIAIYTFRSPQTKHYYTTDGKNVSKWLHIHSLDWEKTQGFKDNKANLNYHFSINNSSFSATRGAPEDISKHNASVLAKPKNGLYHCCC